MERHFYNRMDQGYANAYRPSTEAVKARALWAVVSIEPSPTPSLGESAKSLVAHYASSRDGTIDVDGCPWPSTRVSPATSSRPCAAVSGSTSS
jgi:hypothetical protein